MAISSTIAFVFPISYFCYMLNMRNHTITLVALFYILLLPLNQVIANGQSKRGVSSAKMEIPLYDDAAFKQHIIHNGFELLYNKNNRLPEWVAYELTAEEVVGTAPRGRHYVPDPEVIGEQGSNEDYRNSGWDRGHLVPAGDMKFDEQMMRESFYFSNICPQNRNLNGGDWRTLEELVRVYAQQYGKIYIVCGPIIGDNMFGRLGMHQIVIPDAFFKVLLVETKSGYESIGFVMKNIAGHRPLSNYVKTVDEVEEITGLNFFSLLPNRVEKRVESSYNLSVWNL